ncbi:MAG: hypothetical protein O2955_09105 [Planctomycetota bacterium]|nr:hypothetical protein [Planctomycetota bacterium]MDA1212665.1 hypothetical protein [Planctomycetota bacterium]
MAGGAAAASPGVIHDLLDGVRFTDFGSLKNFFFGHPQTVTDNASGGS